MSTEKKTNKLYLFNCALCTEIQPEILLTNYILFIRYLAEIISWTSRRRFELAYPWMWLFLYMYTWHLVMYLIKLKPHSAKTAKYNTQPNVVRFQYSSLSKSLSQEVQEYIKRVYDYSILCCNNYNFVIAFLLISILFSTEFLETRNNEECY